MDDLIQWLQSLIDTFET